MGRWLDVFAETGSAWLKREVMRLLAVPPSHPSALVMSALVASGNRADIQEPRKEAMSEIDWLRGRWLRLEPSFRRQATANAVGTFAGGLALAVFLGAVALLAQYVAPWTLMAAAAASLMVWMVVIASEPERGSTAAISLVLLFTSGAVFLVSAIAAVARLVL